MADNTVKFGDTFYLKHSTDQYIVAVGTGTYNWPQLGDKTGKVKLQLLSNEGEVVKSPSRIKIKTKEPLKDNNDILGAFADSHDCYYSQDGWNEDKQSWVITKVSGEAGSICYGDQVYFTNCSYTNQNLCADSDYAGYITTAENIKDWWILESDAPVITQVGPVGSSISATDFLIQPKNTTATKIKSINVSANWAVDKIQVEYENPVTNPPEVYLSEAFGGAVDLSTFALAAGDYLTSVSGTWGAQTSTYPKEDIISIQFHTHQGNQSQVFGGANDQKQVEPFTLGAPEGSEIIGFFGASGNNRNVLVRLGIYTRPI
ncbi:jacalin-like lectin [Nostoc sp.]|uniref:jacalin-like lectin n=1 Tax=Nostoc sp. TaxID=1180 RepID=UPI002FF6689C